MKVRLKIYKIMLKPAANSNKIFFYCNMIEIIGILLLTFLVCLLIWLMYDRYYLVQNVGTQMANVISQVNNKTQYEHEFSRQEKERIDKLEADMKTMNVAQESWYKNYAVSQERQDTQLNSLDQHVTQWRNDMALQLQQLGRFS